MLNRASDCSARIHKERLATYVFNIMHVLCTRLCIFYDWQRVVRWEREGRCLYRSDVSISIDTYLHITVFKV